MSAPSDSPKITPHQYSVAGLPAYVINERAKVLRWAYEYMDGDTSTIEDHQWFYMAEQTILANRSHLNAYPDFPVELEWEYGVFGDYFISDEWHEDYPLHYWNWSRQESEARMRTYAQRPEKYRNVRLCCRLVSPMMEVDESGDE